MTKEKGVLQTADYLQEKDKILKYKAMLLSELKKREDKKQNLDIYDSIKAMYVHTLTP